MTWTTPSLTRLVCTARRSKDTMMPLFLMPEDVPDSSTSTAKSVFPWETVTMGNPAHAMDGYTTILRKNADHHQSLLLHLIARPICSNAGMRCTGSSRNCRTAGRIVGRNRRSPRRRNPVNLNMTVMVSSSPSLQNLYLTPKQETTDASLCPPMEEVIRDSHAKDH